MRESAKGALLLAAAVGIAACAPPQVQRDPFSTLRRARPIEGGTKVIVSDVDKPAYKLRERSENYALVIGIEDYAQVPDALFAERDAATVRDHLEALGYPSRNILYLLGKKASRATMEKYIESWLPRNVGEDSRVFFYFSGHGAPGATTGQAYLVPWDGDLQFLEATGYPLKRLYEQLGALKAREVTIVMDACFSGAGGRSVIAKGMRPLVTKVDTALEGTGKLVVLSASAADEITGTEEAQGHGLFTYYFLRALNERRGRATVAQIYKYLRPKVRDAARRSNRDQTPQLMPAGLDKKAKKRRL